MRPQGSFKIGSGSSARERPGDPALRGIRRSRRILDSLRSEIIEGGADESFRIRQIFSSPREIYRLEIDRPGFNYQRTTLLDRDTLEELLEEDAVRDRLELPQAVP